MIKKNEINIVVAMKREAFPLISYWDLNKNIPVTEIRAKNAYNKLLMNRHSEIILSGYYNDRPLVINLLG